MNKHGSKWIRPEKRLAIYMRDRFECAYCLINLTGSKPSEITLDHIVPRKHGGTNDAENLITACLHCNSKRQDTLLDEFSLAFINMRVSLATPLNIELAKAIITGDVHPAELSEMESE